MGTYSQNSSNLQYLMCSYEFSSDRNLLNLVQCKLVIGSIVQLRSARALVSRNLLCCLKSSFIFKVNSYPGGSERVTADRSKDTGIKRSAPDHPVSLGARHCSSGRLFLTESLKQRRIGRKIRFLQVLGHVILRLVMDRHLVMFAALLQESRNQRRRPFS